MSPEQPTKQDVNEQVDNLLPCHPLWNDAQSSPGGCDTMPQSDTITDATTAETVTPETAEEEAARLGVSVRTVYRRRKKMASPDESVTPDKTSGTKAVGQVTDGTVTLLIDALNARIDSQEDRIIDLSRQLEQQTRVIDHQAGVIARLALPEPAKTEADSDTVTVTPEKRRSLLWLWILVSTLAAAGVTSLLWYLLR